MQDELEPNPALSSKVKEASPPLPSPAGEDITDEDLDHAIGHDVGEPLDEAPPPNIEADDPLDPGKDPVSVENSDQTELVNQKKIGNKFVPGPAPGDKIAW